MHKGDLICLYGPSGCGKTRLLQTVEEVFRGTEILRIGAQEIIWKMCASLRYAEMANFRRKYLKIENLLVDNFWVLQNKPIAAGEICGLVSERQSAGKLTVVSSDISQEEWRVKNGRVADLLAGGWSVHLGGHQDVNGV